MTFAGVCPAITAMRSENKPLTQMMASSPSSRAVYDRGFDAAGTGSRQRHGEAVFGLKNLPQQDLHVVHAAAKPGIHVANQGRGQRPVDARVHRGRPRGKHQPVGRIEFADDVCRHESCPILCGTRFSRTGMVRRNRQFGPAAEVGGRFP